MIPKKDQHELITAYLYDDLEETEVKAFEAKMAENADFAEEVEVYAALIGQYHKNQKEQFEEWMEEIDLEEEQENTESGKVVHMNSTPMEKTLKPPSSPSKKSLFQSINRWYAVAAIILLFLMVAFLVQLSSPNALSTEQLVATHLATPHEAPSNSMGVSTTDEATWNQAKDAYKTKNYAQVIALLRPLATANTDKAAVYFYLGLAYLYDENSPSIEAIPPLEQAGNRYSAYKDMANWYVALAYLKGGEMEKAKAVLEEIKKKKGDSTFKHAKAVELLEALNKKTS